MPAGDDTDKLMFAWFLTSFFWAAVWCGLMFIFHAMQLTFVGRLCMGVGVLGVFSMVITGLAIIVRRKL